MEGSMVSSPNKSGCVSEAAQRSSMDHEEEVEVTDDEASPEESTWTEILADFSDLRREERRKEEEEEDLEMSNNSTMSSGSMVSDAGSGPEWKLRNYLNNMNMMMMNYSMPKKLNFMKANLKEMPYDESLKDTASSPINSPKLAMGLKRMDINCKRPDENFDIYHVAQGKGRAIAGRHDYDHDHDHDQAMKPRNAQGSAAAVDPQEKQLGEMGYCLPVTMIMNFNNYY